MKIKRFFSSAAIALMLITAFTACKDKQEDPPNNNNTNNNTPTEYKYATQDTTFMSDTFHMQGTVYVPERKDPAPAILIVPGSGNVNRNGQVASDTAALPAIYRTWARFFAQKGYLVLCYDKRFITYPHIDIPRFNQSDQVHDVEAAAEFLHKRSDVNASAITLLGHSEGGNLVTVAASNKTYVHSVVVLNSPAIPIDSLFIEQLKAANVDQQMVDQTINGFGMVHNGNFPKGGLLWGAGADYWKQWLDYSTRAGEIAGQLNIPVYVAQAEKDKNYPGAMLDKNIDAWKKAAAGYNNIHFNTLPGVDHSLLKEGTTETDESVLVSIYAWIK